MLLMLALAAANKRNQIGGSEGTWIPFPKKSIEGKHFNCLKIHHSDLAINQVSENFFLIIHKVYVHQIRKSWVSSSAGHTMPVFKSVFEIQSEM